MYTLDPIEQEKRKLDIKNAEVRYNQKLTPPPVCLRFAVGSVSYNLFTLENISTILGKAKSRKTFAMTMFFAPFLSTMVNRFHAIGEGKAVYVDTEQDEWRAKRILDRVMKMNNLTEQPSHVRLFCLRPYSPSERLQMLEDYISNEKNLLFMAIDGIRDLISDINNAEQATMITSKLMKWTHEKKMHISNVLHFNKSDNTARGHIGTEIVNKSETVISVRKTENNTSIVAPEFMRDIDFPEFSFRIDNNGIPVIVESATENNLPF